MIITKRSDENHALIMNFYNNGVDPEGEPREGYCRTEEIERRISKLAEAGDALESYLHDYPDDFVREMLIRVDAKIDIIRTTEKELMKKA